MKSERKFISKTAISGARFGFIAGTFMSAICVDSFAQDKGTTAVTKGEVSQAVDVGKIKDLAKSDPKAAAKLVMTLPEGDVAPMQFAMWFRSGQTSLLVKQ